MRELAREWIRWYRNLYPIPGKILVWLVLAILVYGVFAWVTLDNVSRPRHQIRVTRGIQAVSQFYDHN